MKYLALLSVLLCPGFAEATPPVSPKPVITCDWPMTQDGLVTVQVGDILRLSGRMSTADHWLWHVTPDETPQGFATYQADEDGQGVTIATRAGIYRVQMIVANAVGIDHRFVTVRVLDGSGSRPPPVPPTLPPIVPPVDPPTAPPVTPPPTVPPVVPADPQFPGRFGIGRDVYDWAMMVQSPARAAEAKSLANAARSVRAGIAGPKPTITTVNQLVIAIMKTNAEVMRGKNSEAWKGFSDKLGARVSVLISTGAILTVDDGDDLLEEVIVALDKVT